MIRRPIDATRCRPTRPGRAISYPRSVTDRAEQCGDLEDSDSLWILEINRMCMNIRAIVDYHNI
jgi:hypothetical protein